MSFTFWMRPLAVLEVDLDIQAENKLKTSTRLSLFSWTN
jgi:hypothetical protein